MISSNSFKKYYWLVIGLVLVNCADKNDENFIYEINEHLDNIDSVVSQTEESFDEGHKFNKGTSSKDSDTLIIDSTRIWKEIY